MTVAFVSVIVSMGVSGVSVSNIMVVMHRMVIMLECTRIIRGDRRINRR